MVSKVTINCGAKLTEKSSGVKSDKQLWNHLTEKSSGVKVTNNCGAQFTEKSSGVESDK